MVKVLTTGQVARIFGVNINTVIKWYDTGKLAGFRLPRSNERRIYRESVAAFMEAHDIAPALLTWFDDQARQRRQRTSPARPAAPAAPARTGDELRNFERRPVDLPAELETAEGPMPVTVRNLSLGGLYVAGVRGVGGAVPIQLVLRLLPGGLHGPVAVRVELVHLRRLPDDTFGLGCRFTQVEPATLLPLLREL